MGGQPVIGTGDKEGRVHSRLNRCRHRAASVCEKKKGKAGAAKNYVTRNQAIRKLQISLTDFRKLCTWKGIHPREPRSRQQVSKSSTSSTTFSYINDIQYLLHEPSPQTSREHKVLA